MKFFKKMNWYKYASPANFYPLAGKLIPWFAIPSAILFVIGLYVGLFYAPTDFQQGDAYRIIFIHVPAAWMGMMLYILMAIYAAIGWAFNARLSSMMASSISITGTADAGCHADHARGLLAIFNCRGSGPLTVHHP